MKKKIVLTGTHFTPALALIDKLRQEGWQIMYLGRQASLTGSTEPSIEKQLLPQKKIIFKTIVSPKLIRHSLLKSFLNFLKFPIGFIQSLWFLKTFKPAILVSFGGHTALPVCFSAKLLNIPIIIHEQTFAVGLTSKITGKLAEKIAISWPESTKHFPPQKTVLTGNLIRKQLLNLSPALSSNSLYITGGNQGSKIINQNINKILIKLLKKFTVYHQFGLAQKKSDWENQQSIRNLLPNNLKKKYFLKRWFTINDLTTIFNRTNLVISRSGANTITELGFLNKPAILIPLPHAQKNEQLKNAQYLKTFGLAVILPQSKLTPRFLYKKILKANQSLPRKSPNLFPRNLVKNAVNNLYQLILDILSER